MNQREQAAWELHTYLGELGIAYVVIGGMAVQYWGEPRFTQDVDVTVATPSDEPVAFLERIVQRFQPRMADAVTFARKHRVLLVQASNGCPLDISLGLPGYEDEVMARAVSFELAPGMRLRVCSAEDLIVHKAVAGRPQDIRDVEGIVYRQQSALDVEYIRQWLREFADILENPDIAARFEKPWRKVQGL